MQKKLLALFGVVMALAMVLAACQPAAVTPETIVETVIETVIETVEVEVPVEVAPEVVPSTRTGGWFDTIIVIEEPSTDAAITRLEVEEIDAFFYTVANPEAVAAIDAASNIDYWRSSGSYNEFSFNPTGPVWEDGRLNPFAVPRIREAMNYLVDREFITQEIQGGLGTPRWTAFNSASTDAALFAAEIRAIELKYAYNPELAAEIISEEMAALGATLQGGVWTYEGEPVEISILIRIEDERLAMGDYLGNQLEDIGFQVFRDYKSAADASPIWLRGDPNTGAFHIYTGGWITTVIPRDLGGNFAFFYTDTGLPFPLWQNYVNDPEFYELAQRLDRSDYSTLEERAEMVARTLELSMQDGARLWLCDNNSVAPKLTNISGAADLYGNITGGWLWALTTQRAGEVGGSMTIAMPSILTEPWNPIAGSNWIYDMTLIRATSEMATYPDPFTGLHLPNRITSADVVIQEGLPVFSTLDWVDLSFEPEIVVPDDAWADWDAETQQFITSAEKLMLEFEAAEVALAEAEEALEAFLEEFPNAVEDAQADLEAAQADLEAAEAALADLEEDEDTTDEEIEAAKLAVVEATAVLDDATAALEEAEAPQAAVADAVTALEAAAATLERGYKTALRKSTVYYQEDLFDVVYWHDGSPISMGDFLMIMILTFDRAKEASAIFDDAAAPAFASFMQAFKGVRVTSVDPLVIETYSDVYLQDAELSVTTWWPMYAQGIGAWHNMYLGILAEAAGDATFGPGKADVLGVDRISYIAGPTLEILKNQLDLWAGDALKAAQADLEAAEAALAELEEDATNEEREAAQLAVDEATLAFEEITAAEVVMPYAPIFSQFVDEAEMAVRIKNLAEWHRRYGHFWVGTGPYYLQRAFPVEGTVILNNNPMFPDLSTRWNRFAAAPIPVVELDGSARVTVGAEEVYEVMVTFEGQPYPLADISSVRFLVVDATNQIAYVGDAVGVADGLFEIVLTAEITGALATGSNTLEVVVVSNLVAVPVSDGLTFVTVE